MLIESGQEHIIKLREPGTPRYIKSIAKNIMLQTGIVLRRACRITA